MGTKNYLICIVGPTASGKTKTAIDLANHFNTEILNFDSRQFYKELNIGTAKPDEKELSAAKHHFINNLSITENYNSGTFEREAIRFLESFYESNNIMVCVGGSGLYLKALLEGFNEFPKVPGEVRNDLRNKFIVNGLEYIQNELKKIDPECWKNIDKMNHSRILRALEINMISEIPYSELLKKQKKAKRIFTPIIIGLGWDRETLYDRINYRVDRMIEQGLISEVKSLIKFQELNSLQTVGYSELFDFFKERHDLETAIDLIKRNSRRYAKRQITWFNNQLKTNWFKYNELIEMIDFINLEIEK